MSKFFAEGNISDEQNNEQQKEVEIKDKVGPNYQYDFMDDFTSNEKRVVLTEKEKKWNIVREKAQKTNTAINNQDFEKIWDFLQEMLKEIEKMAKLIEKEGYPHFFLRILKKINDEIAEFNSNPDAKKKMKKHSITAFNTMRQKMKKIYPEYEEHIKILEEEGDEDDKVDQYEESSSSSSDSDEEDDKKLLQSNDPMERRKYWLKKPKKKLSGVIEDKDKKQQVQQKEEKDKVEKKKKEKFHIQEKKKKTAAEIASVKDAEIRMRSIVKDFVKLHNQEQREDYLQNLSKIASNNKTYKDFEKLSFLLVDIPIRIEVSRQMRLTHFTRKQWLTIYSNIIEIYHIVKESEEENLIENVILFDESSSNTQKVVASEETILTSIKTFVILIEAELKKSLTYIDSNQPQYSERLQDLLKLIDMMYGLSNDLAVREGLEREASQVGFKVIENIYFMNANVLKKIKEGVSKLFKVDFIELAKEQLFTNYVNNILKLIGDEDTKIKALLYLIYNCAINRREKGKNLLTASIIPETIHQMDYYTQSIYNRVLAQLGLAAFRNGTMSEVQQYLSEICSNGKSKYLNKDVLRELLAQGYLRGFVEKDIPKSKILPVYLHLNAETIESVELIASMLLQIPYTLNEGGRVSSKTFKKVYYDSSKSFFLPEKINSKDLVFTAGKHLKEGNWVQCYSTLCELNIWKDLVDAEQTKKNLEKFVREQSLKCFLVGNKKCFKSISIQGLSQKFEFEEKTIRKLMCKMINQKFIQGAFTSTGYFNFFQKGQTETQKISETIFEKLNDISQANESLFNQRFQAADNDEEDEEVEKFETHMQRKSNIAINEKLRSILSKRKQLS